MGKQSSQLVTSVELKDGNGERFVVDLLIDLNQAQKAAAALANKAQSERRSYASACYGLVQARVRKIG